MLLVPRAIAFTTGLHGPSEDGFDPDAERAELDRLAAAGVTWSSVGMPGDSLARAIEALHRYGDEVIAGT